jgi:excisionase family DNA binding protein
MAKKSLTLTSREFSDKTGIPVATVNRLLREGKIKGAKSSGKWLIDRGELNAKAVQAFLKTADRSISSKAAPKSVEKKGITRQFKPTDKTYSVAEFSALTYLTERGVVDYIIKGRLQGARDEKGNWQLSHENLQNPRIRHLIR